MVDELEKQIREYIESHNICTIAVADNNSPSAHTVYYVNDGFRIYFETSAQSDKVRILKLNNKISLTIDENYQNWEEIKGVQMFGRARVIEVRSSPQLKEEFERKFSHLKDVGGIPEHHVFVEVTPEKIYFIDFSNIAEPKSTYFPKELGQGFLSKINW